VKNNFEQQGLYVTKGFGPLKGDTGATIMYPNPEKQIHLVGFETVPHHLESLRLDGLEPQTSSEEGKKEIELFQKAFSDTFRELAKLKAEDLK